MQTLLLFYIYAELFAALLFPHRAVSIQSQACHCIAWLSCVLSSFPKHYHTDPEKASDLWRVKMWNMHHSGIDKSEIDCALDDSVHIGEMRG